MATMLSYDGICCIGVNFDPGVISDEPVFSRCLQEGFDEVLRLADQPKRRRTDVSR
jgi:diacylglycerol O-acyltransferase / wax synthase